MGQESKSCKKTYREHRYGSPELAKQERGYYKGLLKRAYPRPAFLDILLVKAKIVEPEERLAKFSSRPPLSGHVVSIHPLRGHPSRRQMNAPHVDTETLGFPTGYFLIRSVATGRLLDIYGNAKEDSSPLALWPAKEQSLVESTSVRSPIQITFVSHRHDHLRYISSPSVARCRQPGKPPDQ